MKSPKTLRLIGTLGGILVLFLATTEFMRSFNEGSTKWNYLLMIFGMAIILVYNVFNKKKKRKKKKLGR